uniref:Ig-like domain-containing protein n=1 Tax=Paramormyrops kingsleyae TaxID=1676925 RepID=A0A3B3T0B7_9TELE
MFLMLRHSCSLPIEFQMKTFEKLTAQAGGSISIPCFYGQEHKDSVKSWCKGRDTSSCSPETRSDSQLAMNRVFITDDPQNLVFIVTMRDLQHMDSGSYWCCVGDGCRRSEDSSGKLELLVSTGNVGESMTLGGGGRGGVWGEHNHII